MRELIAKWRNYEKWLEEHFDDSRLATDICADELEAALTGLGVKWSHLDDVRKLFSQRHPIESLFFEQWLKETAFIPPTHERTTRCFTEHYNCGDAVDPRERR